VGRAQGRARAMGHSQGQGLSFYAAPLPAPRGHNRTASPSKPTMCSLLCAFKTLILSPFEFKV
jgi:hypothetical protein